MRKLSYKWPVWLTLIAFSMPVFYVFFRIRKPQIFDANELVGKVVAAVFFTIIAWLVYGVACLFASPISETSEEKIEEEGNSEDDAAASREAELLQEAEELHHEFFEKLPTKVKCKSVSAPENERIPFKAHLAKVGLIYRAVDITGVALDLVKKKRTTAAFILARCVFETAAVLFLLYQRLQRVVETNKLGNINDFLNRVTIGGRSEFARKAPDGSIIKSVHISNAIDKLSKEYKNLAREYGFICEFAHPNFLGTLGSYGKLNKERNFYSFSLDASYKNIPEPNAYGLNMLVVSLLIVKSYCKELTDILPRFTEICEAESKNSKDE